MSHEIDRDEFQLDSAIPPKLSIGDLLNLSRPAGTQHSAAALGTQSQVHHSRHQRGKGKRGVGLGAPALRPYTGAAHRRVGGRRRLEGSVPRGRGLGFARATSISSWTTVTPLSHIPQPCNDPNGPKGLQSNKNKNKTCIQKTFTVSYQSVSGRPACYTIDDSHVNPVGAPNDVMACKASSPNAPLLATHILLHLRRTFQW